MLNLHGTNIWEPQHDCYIQICYNEVCYKGTLPGRVAQSVTCLTADPAWFYTFVEIDHKIISKAILLPSADSRRVVVRHVHEVLVNR